ncbi:MAG: GNAT family N-acetyltransferase [Pirellulaceae bacterium]|nr:GNAT family N-acetyltransferase [Pirellulaceae bacterium]
MDAPGNTTLDDRPKATVPTVRPLEVEQDREAVLDLWRRNLPEGASERYEWLYRSGRARGWLGCDTLGNAVGAIGLLSREMRLFGSPCSAGQPIDLNVDRGHRLGGLAMRLQRSLIDAAGDGRPALIYGLPNAQSEAVLRRVGYEVVGTVQRWARPLKSREYFSERMPQGVVGDLTSRALDAALWLRSPESRYWRRRDHRVEVTDRFDERFDRLAREVADRHPVFGDRSADYLNWRFRDAPGAVFRILCLSSPSDRLLAYLVYHQRDGVAYMADFLGLDESHGDAVLAEFIRLMRSQKTKAVVTIFSGAKSVTRRLRRFGFQRRPSSWKIMLHADAIQLGIPRFKLPDPSQWYLTRADIDTEF